MSNPLSHLARRRFKRKKSDRAQLAAQLAPLEEQIRSRNGGNEHNNSLAHQEVGAIVVEGDPASVSRGLADVREDSGHRGLEPVVLVILVVVLSFIAFIAWQISLMPEK